MTREEKAVLLAVKYALLREEAYQSMDDRLRKFMHALEQEQQCAKRRLWLAIAAFPAGMLVGCVIMAWIGR